MDLSRLPYADLLPWWIALAAIVLLFFARPIIWWLFSFDRDVRRALSQAKSSEVKTGKLVESLAPILDNFPVDVQKPGTSTVYIGQPVDFIHFDPEEGITVIEVKSGMAQLSDSQRKLRALVEARKIAWKTFRVE